MEATFAIEYICGHRDEYFVDYWLDEGTHKPHEKLIGMECGLCIAHALSDPELVGENVSENLVQRLSCLDDFWTHKDPKNRIDPDVNVQCSYKCKHFETFRAEKQGYSIEWRFPDQICGFCVAFGDDEWENAMEIIQREVPEGAIDGNSENVFDVNGDIPCVDLEAPRPTYEEWMIKCGYQADNGDCEEDDELCMKENVAY